jgi:hypothetical protein
VLLLLLFNRFLTSAIISPFPAIGPPSASLAEKSVQSHCRIALMVHGSIVDLGKT